MSASTGLAKQADGLQQLLALASLNKADIAAAGEETRRQLQLTQAEQGKLAEAKIYIAKHASLAAELQGREDALAEEKTKFQFDKEQFITHLSSENIRLEGFSLKLDERDRQTTALAAQTLKEKESLAALRIDQERQHCETLSVAQTTQATADAQIQANAIETERLKEWEATLKRKAELLRQQAANF